MLRALEPFERPSERAYPVPWLIDGSDPANINLINVSTDTLTGILVTSLQSGALLTEHAHRLSPFDSLAFGFPAAEQPESAVALVAWVCDGVQYLYRVTL